MTTTNRITEDESFAMGHCSMFGSDAYPVFKRGSRWWVDGIRGCGKFPKGFPTKREATAQWEAYLGILLDRKAGRLCP